MADMFGVSDAEINLRDPLRRAQAQEALGRVAMQPAEQALKEAQAAHYQAEAQERLLKIKRAKELDALSIAALANGEPLEAAQALSFLESQGQSASAPLQRVYKEGVKRGTSAAVLAPLAEKIATIQLKEAQTGGALQLEEKRRLDAQHAQAERFGSLAQAALQGPEHWARLRLQTPELNTLPQSWEAAKPYLKNISVSAMRVKDSIEAKRKAARDAQLDKVNASTIARNEAAATASKAQTSLRTQKYNNVAKNNGVGDPLTAEEKRLQIRAKKLEIEKRQLAIAPLVPTKDQLVENQAYTLPGGKIGVWRQDPTSGQKGFVYTTLEDLANLEEEPDTEEESE